MVFFEECTSETYSDLKARVKNDDDDLKKLIQDLSHRELNFVILNLGNMLQLCAIYFELKQENIESYLKLEKDKLKQSRMKTIIVELNQSINLRFDFPEDTEIIEGLFIYDGDSYISINKMLFVELILQHQEEYPNI